LAHENEESKRLPEILAGVAGRYPGVRFLLSGEWLGQPEDLHRDGTAWIIAASPNRTNSA